MAFRIGQRVICIDADDRGQYTPGLFRGSLLTGLDGLREGAIYTVRGVGPFVGFPCLWLEEIERPPFLDCGEPGYAIQRFRPLTERKNDGEAFVEQLKRDCIPSPMKVNEREGAE